jgi:hypothetical protein
MFCSGRTSREDAWLDGFFRSNPRWRLWNGHLKLVAGNRVIRLQRHRVQGRSAQATQRSAWTRCHGHPPRVRNLQVSKLTCPKARKAIRRGRFEQTPGGEIFSTRGFGCDSPVGPPRKPPIHPLPQRAPRFQVLRSLRSRAIRWSCRPPPARRAWWPASAPGPSLFGRRRGALFVLAGLHPASDLLHHPPCAPIGERVEGHRPLLATGKQARPPENVQMMGGGLVGPVDLVGQLLNATFARGVRDRARRLTSPSGSSPMAAPMRSRSFRPSLRSDFKAAGRTSIRHPSRSASVQLHLGVRPRKSTVGQPGPCLSVADLSRSAPSESA